MDGTKCNFADGSTKEVLSPENGETINLYGKIAVLVAGQVTSPNSLINHNRHLIGRRCFSGKRQVFVRNA